LSARRNFHQNKKTVSFAPLFQPLLGPIDHAAEALMLRYLSEDVPSEASAQRDYVEPDMAKAKKSDIKYLSERAGTLRKLLVHRSPLMPTGALSFCFDYAAKVVEPPPGIYASVRARFSRLATTSLPKQVKSMYEFRNTYIAHQKGDLTDLDRTRVALREWIDVLDALHRAVSAGP
jgi:type III restriction enzyme